MAAAPKVKNFKRHLEALFKNNDGGLADVTVTLRDKEKLYLHSIMLINVPSMRDALLGLNGQPRTLAFRAVEPPAAVRAFFAHIYGAPVESWCASWLCPSSVHRFLELYDLSPERGAMELWADICKYLHARLHADLKRGTDFSADGKHIGWIWVLAGRTFPAEGKKRARAAERWGDLQQLVLRVLWKRKREVESRYWERGLEKCEGFAIALRALEWIVRPRGPGSGVSVA